MANVFQRSLLGAVLLAFLLTVGLLFLSGYIFFRLGNLGLEESARLTRGRGEELAAAIAQLASEVDLLEGDSQVQLSSVMAEMVRRSNERNVSFTVDEVALLSASGEVIAHNEVALVAHDAETDFASEEYTAVLGRTERDPTIVRVVGQESVEHIALFQSIQEAVPALGEWMAPLFPSAVNTKYHIARAVFSPNQDVPRASLHLFASAHNVNKYVTSLETYSVETLAMLAGFIFLVTMVLFLFMILGFRAELPPETMATVAAHTESSDEVRPAIPDSPDEIREEDHDEELLGDSVGALPAEPAARHSGSPFRQAGTSGLSTPSHWWSLRAGRSGWWRPTDRTG